MKSIFKFFAGLKFGGWVIIGVFIFGITYGVTKLMPKRVQEAQVIAIDDVPALAYDANANAPFRQTPSLDAPLSENPGREYRVGVMGWNAQSGILYSNGGARTVQGSIYDSLGIKVNIVTQNDCGKQAEGLYAFVEDYAKGNKNSQKGYNMIAWMGDGVPSYIVDLNKRIEETLGEEFIIQTFMAAGASFGEDKGIFENDSFKNNPDALRGTLWEGVIRDGDWNLIMKYAEQNGIPVNNDLTTFDPEAINWKAAPENSYIRAVEDYNNRVKETRKIVNKGKVTDRDTTVMVRGVVTWTPGDKMAYEGRGGYSVISTAEFSAQMANIWLAPKKFLEDNAKGIEDFILGAGLGGDQVKSHKSALVYATSIAQKVYNDDSMTAKDWYDFFIGVDIKGEKAGGSRVFNLADMAEYFGLNGGQDKYMSVYNAYGKLQSNAYPDLMPEVYPYEKVMNSTYMQKVWDVHKNDVEMTVASKPQFASNQQAGEVVTSKSYDIKFKTGSAEIDASSTRVLEDLMETFTIAENLMVVIEGHTDDVGDDDANMRLSEARAQSVKDWFMERNGKAFKNKIQAKGYGETKPKQNGMDAASRAANRRVEIKLAKAQ
jgi:outer membrane protein OmpA-like peptidoglycan-associated protein